MEFKLDKKYKKYYKVNNIEEIDHYNKSKEKDKQIKGFYVNIRNINRFINLDEYTINDSSNIALLKKGYDSPHLNNYYKSDSSYTNIRNELGLQSIIRRVGKNSYKISYSKLYNLLTEDKSTINIIRREYAVLTFNKKDGFVRADHDYSYSRIAKNILIEALYKIKPAKYLLDIVELIDKEYLEIEEVNNLYFASLSLYNPKKNNWKNFRTIFNSLEIYNNYVIFEDFKKIYGLTTNQVKIIEDLLVKSTNIQDHIKGFIKNASYLFEKDYIKYFYIIPSDMIENFIKFVSSCSSEKEIDNLMNYEKYFLKFNTIAEPVENIDKYFNKKQKFKDLDLNLIDKIKLINIEKFFDHLETNNFKITKDEYKDSYKIFKLNIISDPIWALNYLYKPDEIMNAYMDKINNQSKDEPILKDLTTTIEYDSTINSHKIKIKHPSLKKSNLNIIESILYHININSAYPITLLKKDNYLTEKQFEMMGNALNNLFLNFSIDSDMKKERREGYLYQYTRDIIMPILNFYKSIHSLDIPIENLNKYSFYDVVNLILSVFLFNINDAAHGFLSPNKRYYNSSFYMTRDIREIIKCFVAIVDVIENENYPSNIRDNINKDLIKSIDNYPIVVSKYSKLLLPSKLNSSYHKISWGYNYNEFVRIAYKDLVLNNIIKDTDEPVYHKVLGEYQLLNKNKDNIITKELLHSVISFAYNNNISLYDIIADYKYTYSDKYKALMLKDKDGQYFIIYKMFNKYHKHYI